jgi:hypothetical protein
MAGRGGNLAFRIGINVGEIISTVTTSSVTASTSQRGAAYSPTTSQ